MKILFTRHGESLANQLHIISNRNLPHPLTSKGVSQARDLAERLAAFSISRIYTSPIPRALETAEILATRLGLPLSITPALREFDCGEMEGRGDAAAWAAHAAVTKAWDAEREFERRIPPDGESFNEMRARFLPFIDALLSEKDVPGDILLVSHGAVLYQMLPLVLANVDRAFTQAHPLANCDLIVSHLEDERLVCENWAGIKMV